MKSTGAQQVMGNRTDIQTSPELAEELIEGASNAEPSSEGGVEFACWGSYEVAPGEELLFDRRTFLFENIKTHPTLLVRSNRVVV